MPKVSARSQRKRLTRRKGDYRQHVARKRSADQRTYVLNDVNEMVKVADVPKGFKVEEIAGMPEEIAVADVAKISQAPEVKDKDPLPLSQLISCLKRHIWRTRYKPKLRSVPDFFVEKTVISPDKGKNSGHSDRVGKDCPKILAGGQKEMGFAHPSETKEQGALYNSV